MMRSFFIAGLLVLAQGTGWADTARDSESTPQKMDNQRLQGLIERVADDVEGDPGFWKFELEGFQTTVITDEKADRMRIIVPVAAMKEVNHDHLYRMMQANFDSALDSRYSIAKGILWSAFIHPLSTLTDNQFVDAMAQTVNLAATYGTTYSSGALIFSEGDSQGEQNRYYQEIIDRANSI
jgi:hypothetical protein